MTAVGRIARNAVSVLASDAAGRAATFVLYALVARFLGAFEFGQLSLALAFFYPGQVVAVAGLKVLLTREVARRPDLATRYLVNAGVVVVGAALVSLGGVAVLTRLLGYAPDTTAVIVLMALALLPYALTAVSEGILQALEAMHLIAVAQVPANVLKVVLAFAVLATGRGVLAVTALVVGIHVLVMVVEWTLLLTRTGVPRQAPRRDVARGLVRATRPFLGIEGLVAITASANIVILSQFAGERQVGLFSAAMQVMVPIGMLVTSTVLSVFPVMSRRFDRGVAALRDATALLFGVLLGLAVPAAIGLTYAAEEVLVLLYGDPGFARSAVVVRIAVWGVLAMAASAVLGQALLAANRETVNVRIVAVNAVVSVVVGIALISTWGIVGGAVSLVVVQVVNLALHYRPVARLLPRLSLAGLLGRRVLAGACMAGVLVLADQRHVVVGLLAGAVAYAVALVATEVVAAGGLAALRSRYGLISSG